MGYGHGRGIGEARGNLLREMRMRVILWVVGRVVEEGFVDMGSTMEGVKILTGCIYRDIKKDKLVKALQHYLCR